MENKEVIKAIMIGHAVGDALGVPAEFSSREDMDKVPMDDMEGYGTYALPEGSWSDDTSMSIAALDSLKRGYVDFEDVMHRFESWLYGNEYTSVGYVFDVGSTCNDAISNYHNNRGKILPTECGMKSENSNGNGSLMRIHPFVLFAYSKGMSMPELLSLVDSASSLTHAHPRARLACKIYAIVLTDLLYDRRIESVESSLNYARDYFKCHDQIAYFERLLSPDFKNTPREEIQSGGYVVHTLEAAIWCLLNSSDYKECVLKATNLGRDTDTVAAVAGGLAAALYGYSSIPDPWVKTLRRRDYIERICEDCASGW